MIVALVFGGIAIGTLIVEIVKPFWLALLTSVCAGCAYGLILYRIFNIRIA